MHYTHCRPYCTCWISHFNANHPYESMQNNLSSRHHSQRSGNGRYDNTAYNDDVTQQWRGSSTGGVGSNGGQSEGIRFVDRHLLVAVLKVATRRTFLSHVYKDTVELNTNSPIDVHIPTPAAHLITAWPWPMTFWHQGQCMQRCCHTVHVNKIWSW